MNIQFDENISQNQAQGIILLLTTLFPTMNNSQPVSHSTAPAPTLQTAIESTTDLQQQTETRSGGPELVILPEQPSTRKRRTKEQIAMDEAAKQAPMEAVRGSLNVSEAGDVEVAAKVPATPTETSAKPITADELRASLNAYIAKHSMEEAIAILKSFGCGRVSEALALDPAKLAELAGQLNG